MAPAPGTAAFSRFDAVKSALTTAEHDFLHAVGDRTELTWERYAALVAELRQRRDALLHDVEVELRAAEAPEAPTDAWLGLLYATERARLGS